MIHAKFVDRIARKFLDIRARLGTEGAKVYARRHLKDVPDADTDLIAQRITTLTQGKPDPRRKA